MREQALLQAGQKHHRKLQALGVVQGQQRHRRGFVEGVGFRHQRGVIQKIAQPFRRARRLRLAAFDQFVQVLQARSRVRASSPAPAFCGSRCGPARSASAPAKRRRSPPAKAPASGCGKPPARIARAWRDSARRSYRSMAAHRLMFFSSAYCSICSTVVRPMPRAGVLMMRSRLDRIGAGRGQLQVRDDVLDFGALIEAEAADHDVFAAVAAQRFFNLPRLRIGAVEHGDAIRRDWRDRCFSMVSAMNSASFSAS